MYAEERRNKIIEYLEQNGRADAPELAELLQTSRETIRRDLKDLSQRGLIVKTHGGALAGSNSTVWQDIPLTLRETKNREAKRDLCAYAAPFINENDTIFLDNSSTVIQLINYIPKKMHVTIITNSIKVLLDIAKMNSTNWDIIHLGGNFSTTTLSTNSYIALSNFEMFMPTKIFISCHGIDSTYTVTDSYMDDVALKKSAMESAKELFLLVDHSKLGRPGVVRIVGSEQFHHIITNDNADSGFVKALQQRGSKVHLAKSKK